MEKNNLIKIYTMEPDRMTFKFNKNREFPSNDKVWKFSNRSLIDKVSQEDSDMHMFKSSRQSRFNRESVRTFKSQRLVRLTLKDRVNEMIERVSKQVSKQDKKRLGLMVKKIKDQKRFLNMVVHDLRNPAESIHQALKLVQDISDREYDKIL